MPVMESNATRGIVDAVETLGSIGPFEVRASYFGICAIDKDSVVCSSSATDLLSLQFDDQVCNLQ